MDKSVCRSGLVGWLVDQLFGRSVDQLVGQAVCQAVCQAVGLAIVWPGGQLERQTVRWAVRWSGG